jgi:hypothetical protein
MSDVSSGFVWEGTLTRTPNMNKLENKLDFDFSYNGVEVSANFVYDVVENSELINKKWNFSNSDIINQGFSKQMQMSPNGLLMGFIDGSNVEIYRKSESSNWVTDVSYNCHSFALTNNHIILANETMLEIYDYSGSSWSIMNGGNIAYLNVVALSINVDGTYVAVSNNADVKVLQNISDNWTHINTYNNGSVIGLSLSPNGLKLGMGIGTVGQDYSSIMVEDVVNNDPPVITLVGDAIINHEVNTAYTDLGATANDNFYGDITGIIITNNNVDTSTLGGTYTITYDVSNSNNISAIQKIRTVNVIDTTPPIVVLNGDAVVTLTIGDTYTELGATATDNSLESLGVVIAGDVVDENTLGTYLITYTATDSTGNSHQITRTVNVITAPSTIQYSNPTTNLLNDVVNFASHMATYGHANTNYDFTETNNATDSVFNGSYNVKGSSYFRTSNPIANVFDGSDATNWQGIKNASHGADVTNSWEFGQIYNADVYAYDSSGNYQQQTFSVVGGGTVVVNHTVTANGTQYAGEYFEITFPFEIIVNKFEYLGAGGRYFTSGALLGSNDNGTSYELVSTINATSVSHTENITTSNKYKTFRYVMMTGTTSYYSYVKYIKLFGDIYS